MESERREKAVGRGVTRLKDSGSLLRGSSLGWTTGLKLGWKGCGGGLGGKEIVSIDMLRFLEG